MNLPRIYERFGLALIVAALFFTLLLTPMAQAQTIHIQHAKGEISLAAPPKTVLVLDIPTLDTLDALNVEVTGVPEGNLVSYLRQYQDARYVKIGTLFEPDLAAIEAAGADLIIVGGRSSAKYGEVSKLAPTIDFGPDKQRDLESAREHIATLGRIFDKPREAAQLIATLDEKAAALRTAAERAGSTAMLITNAGRIGIYGAGARTDWLYQNIGFHAVPISTAPNPDPQNRDSAAAASAAAFAQAMQHNPDWIFIVDRNAAIGQGTPENAAQRVLGENALASQTNAWKNGQVVYLLPQEAYIVGSGYQALTRLMDQVFQAVSAKP